MSKLSPAQAEMLALIKAAGPEGLIVDKTCVSASSLLRKGLVVRVDVETAPATKFYTNRFDCYTLRGRLRMVTMCRYTAV